MFRLADLAREPGRSPHVFRCQVFWEYAYLKSPLKQGHGPALPRLRGRTELSGCRRGPEACVTAPWFKSPTPNHLPRRNSLTLRFRRIPLDALGPACQATAPTSPHGTSHTGQYRPAHPKSQPSRQHSGPLRFLGRQRSPRKCLPGRMQRQEFTFRKADIRRPSGRIHVDSG